MSVACSRGELDPDSRRRLIDEAPGSLADIVRLYDRCQPEIQQELTALVRSEKIMERYAAGLKDGAPQGVLIDAWRLFPDENTLRSFVELLASRDEDTQRAAVRLLSTMQEPQVLPMLVLGAALFVKAPDLLRKRLKSREARGTQQRVIGFSALFSEYLNHSASFGIYGSLTTIIIALLWMYYCMYILLLGSYFNAKF